MPDFWPRCGYHLLERSCEGRLAVTDAYLRQYFERPELALVEESCAAERALRQRLIDEPRTTVTEHELAQLADSDAQENYRVMLRFRDQLLRSETLEAFYFDLFRRDVAVPPAFIHHTVQVILRGLLDGCDSGLELRASELFFRRQKVSIERGMVMLADHEVVDAYAADAGLGRVGRLLRELQAPLTATELDVLNDANHQAYFARDERHDLVLPMNPGTPGAAAYARVIERWVAHFHGVTVHIEPVREIPDEEWTWHVGLDAEASAMLNDIYTGAEPDADAMKRVIGLFRMDFEEDAPVLVQARGKPVFLGFAMTPEHSVWMKPQNLLMNLPLSQRS